MNRVRYGIVGYGRFAERTIAPAIQATENSELVALQKRSRTVAEQKARELGIPLAFDSVEALLEHPGIDAVFIGSANSLHCPETVAAARAGKHVLVEKPMAMNVAEAQEMIDACASGGVRLMVGHMLRFSPLLRRIRKLLREKAIGRIVSARADFMYDGRLSHRSWLRDRRVAGGGPVYDVGVHCLDSLRFVLSAEVTETESLLTPEPTASVTESTALIQLRFSDGTSGSIYCSYDAPLRKTLMEIIGTQGIISAADFTSGERTIPLVIARGANDQILEERIERITVPNLYRAEIWHFSDCILKKRKPFLSGENGLRNQAVLEAATLGRR